MNQKFLDLLGLCRRAGKLSGGHDAAFGAIQHGKAAACFLTADASERLKAEFQRTVRYHGRRVPLYELDGTRADIASATGSGFAVFTADDPGFAKRLIQLLNEEDSF